MGNSIIILTLIGYSLICMMKVGSALYYNQETNKVQLKVEEAKVILDIDIFGNNIVLTELDIAHYFSKPFNLNGPQPMAEHIEFDLPNGEVREIKVGKDQSYMMLEKDAILVKTSLNFSQ